MKQIITDKEIRKLSKLYADHRNIKDKERSALKDHALAINDFERGFRECLLMFFRGKKSEVK